MSQQPSPVTNVFDAAKAIVETLKDVDKQLQAQAIRFACESLGVDSPVQGRPMAGSSSMPAPPSPSANPTHSTDIKQFTAAKAPKSDQQFAAVVAYFYRFEASEPERRETIDAKALEDAARKAQRKRPSNARMTLTNAKNAGYLDLVGRGDYKINSVGENLVAMTLPGNNSEAPARRGARKGTGSRTQRARKR